MSTKAEALQRLLTEVRDRIGGSAPKWPSQVIGTLDEMGALRLDTDELPDPGVLATQLERLVKGDETLRKSFGGCLAIFEAIHVLKNLDAIHKRKQAKES